MSEQADRDSAWCACGDHLAVHALPAPHLCTARTCPGCTGWTPKAKAQVVAEGPEFAPHVAQALEDSGAALVGLLAPWVAMVQARDETLGLAIPTLLELQASHAALLEYIERRGIRPSFAHDVRTLEQAHALAERLNAEDRT